VRAARRAFESKGFAETRITDITTKARVAYGTFYTYFDSKEKVYEEVTRELTEEFRLVAATEPKVGDDPFSRVLRANRGYLRAYRKNARMMAIIEEVAAMSAEHAELRKSNRRYWVERTERTIKRWQHDGLVPADVDPATAASALGSMIDRTAYLWYVLGEAHDEEHGAEQLTLLYTRALGIGPDTSRDGMR
jgi:AcrR family transcriptional regulator